MKIVLFGPKSLEYASLRKPGPKGYARQWDLKSVTPGCVAMAAVVVSDHSSMLYDTHYPPAGTIPPLTRPRVLRKRLYLQDWLLRSLQTIQEVHYPAFTHNANEGTVCTD